MAGLWELVIRVGSAPSRNINCGNFLSRFIPLDVAEIVNSPKPPDNLSFTQDGAKGVDFRHAKASIPTKNSRQRAISYGTIDEFPEFFLRNGTQGEYGPNQMPRHEAF